MLKDLVKISYGCPACGAPLAPKDATRLVTRPSLRWWHAPSQVQISACPHCKATLKLKGVGAVLSAVAVYGALLGIIEAFLVPQGFAKVLFILAGLLSCVLLALFLKRVIRYVQP